MSYYVQIPAYVVQPSTVLFKELYSMGIKRSQINFVRFVPAADPANDYKIYKLDIDSESALALILKSRNIKLLDTNLKQRTNFNF